MPQPATVELSEALRKRTGDVMLLASALWEQVGPGGDWAAQWARQIPRLVALVGAAQVGAAVDGAAVVPVALEQSGFPPETFGEVDPQAFTGWVSPVGAAQVPLAEHLFWPLVVARSSPAQEPEEMLQAGAVDLAARVHFAVADAAGQATGVGITATRDAVATWYDPPPYCQRCAVLIGKRVSVNFQRHPRCDGGLNPRSVHDRSAEPVMRIDQVKDLTVAQKRAIADGADFNQVVNAKRKTAASRIGGREVTVTTEGTTRRGWASSVRREVARQRGEIAQESATNVGRRGAVQAYTVRRTAPRLTPAAIYQYAASREEAVRLLALNGYLVGPLGDVARLGALPV